MAFRKPPATLTFAGTGDATTTISVVEQIGAGCFSVVYRGCNRDSSEEVAIKFEPKRTAAPQLNHEYELLVELSRTIKPQGFTVPLAFTDAGSHRALVVPLLGQSLESCCLKLRGERLSVKTVLMIAEQVLRRIEYLHSFGIVHRDIKPANFAWGGGAEGNQLYLIDFGLSKRYFDYGRSSHNPMKSGLSLTGTARYASINAHKGYEQSRRDDMEAVGYMFAGFLRTPLPWSGLGAKTKEEMYRKIVEKKESTPAAVLFDGFPGAFVQYLEEVRCLEYSQAPDYSGLRMRFADQFQTLGFQEDYLFDWCPADSPSFDPIGPWTAPLQPDDPSSTSRAGDVIHMEDVKSKDLVVGFKAFFGKFSTWKQEPSKPDSPKLELPMFADAATRAAAEQKWTAEQESTARAVFKKWDLNGDGTLSIEELREVLATLDITGKVFDEIFTALDKNRNGTVEVDEFLTWVFGEAREDIREACFSCALHEPLEMT